MKFNYEDKILEVNNKYLNKATELYLKHVSELDGSQMLFSDARQMIAQQCYNTLIAYKGKTQYSDDFLEMVLKYFLQVIKEKKKGINNDKN